MTGNTDFQYLKQVCCVSDSSVLCEAVGRQEEEDSGKEDEGSGKVLKALQLLPPDTCLSKLTEYLQLAKA